MKGCIVIIRESGPILHELASKIQRDHGVSWSAYMGSRELEERCRALGNMPYGSVLREDTLYEKARGTVLDPPLLERFEKQYGKPFLWPYLIGDKHIIMSSRVRVLYSYAPSYSHDDMLKILQAFLTSIEEFLDREKPDVLVSAGIGSLATHILYEMAKKKGIRTLDIQTARMAGRVAITEDYKTLTGAEALFASMRAGAYASPRRSDAQEFIREFRSRPATYSQTFFSFGSRVRFAFLAPARIRKTALTLMRTVRLWIANTLTGRKRTVANPLRLAYELAIKKIRAIMSPGLAQRPPAGESFAFFPLQVEPEVYNNIVAPYYVNQIELARAIARSLPVGWKLYVKEHPIMRGMRKLSYYRKLKAIPNVRLIDDALSSYELIASARLAATGLGTVGWEAALMKKPVVTFAPAFYNVLSSVTRCAEIDLLPAAVAHALKSTPPDDSELTDLVAALLEDSAPFDFMKFLYTSIEKNTADVIRREPGFDEFAGLLAKKIHL